MHLPARLDSSVALQRCPIPRHAPLDFGVSMPLRCLCCVPSVNMRRLLPRHVLIVFRVRLTDCLPRE
jgi:hypothetical protein